MTSVLKCVRTAFAFAAVLLASSTLLHAQITAVATPASLGVTPDNERIDVYGGAAYSHFNPGYAHKVQATNLVGFTAAGTAWLGKRWGAEASVKGLYGNYNVPSSGFNLPATSNLSEYVFLFGPTVRLYQSAKYSAGAHLLIGGAYGSFDQGFSGSGIQPFTIGVYNNQLAFAAAFGAWGDYKLSDRLAVRAIADYQPTRYGGFYQNEFAGSVGLVYKFGQRH